MTVRVKTWKRRAAEQLSSLLDRAERLPGRRFYELHLEAAARRHRQGSNVVDLVVGDDKIKFRTPSGKSLWRAQTLLTKEPATINWIDNFNPGDVFWDIGANVGIYSLYAAMVKEAQVLAFEPAAFNHALLCDNIRLNRLEERIDAYGIAFSDRSQLGRLNFADDEPGVALASVEDSNVGSLKQAALVFSIDDFIEQFSPPFPTHVKIDVDGVEAEIVDGARHTLADPRLKSLLVEVDESEESQPERIDTILSEFGLQLVDVQSSPLAPNSASRNRIFRRS